MVTAVTNNTIDSNTLMGYNFQLHQIEDYHLAFNISSLLGDDNNAWVNSNDFSTYSLIHNSIVSMDSNLLGYAVQLQSNVIKTSNTFTNLTDNVFFINTAAISSEYIDVFSNGLILTTNLWVYNNSNSSVQLLDSSIDPSTNVYISYFVENELNKVDSDSIIDNSIHIFSINNDIILPTHSLNFEKIEQSNSLIYNIQSNTTTTVNKKGYIENVLPNTVRRYYDPATKQSLGVYVTDNIINKANLSEDFSFFTAQGNIINTSDISPNNILSSTKFISNDTSGIKYLYRDIDNLVVNNTYCISIWAKQEDIGRLAISSNTGSSLTSIYDTTNLSVYENSSQELLNSTIEKYNNGWYRCSHAINADSTTMNLKIGVNSSSASNIFVFGTQINDGIYPELYIPTQEDVINISKDNCLISVNQYINDYDYTISGTVKKISNTESITLYSIYDEVYDITNNTYLNNSYTTTISIDELGNYVQISTNANSISTGSVASTEINLIRLGGQESIIFQNINLWNSSLSNSEIYTLN